MFFSLVDAISLQIIDTAHRSVSNFCINVRFFTNDLCRILGVFETKMIHNTSEVKEECEIPDGRRKMTYLMSLVGCFWRFS